MSDLQCIKCNEPMSNFIDAAKGMQPNGGLAFHTHGHYGTTYFDPMDGQSYLEVSICDKCVKDAEQRGLVYRHVATPQGER